MNQDQQPDQRKRASWKAYSRPLFSASSLILFLIAMVSSLWYLRGRTWTGFDGKTLWEWLELLIIPAALGLFALWFAWETKKADRQTEDERRKSEQALAQMERENDRELALDRAREEALQRYLDRMQELILDRGLRTSAKDAEIREVFRARTLAVLRTLDGTRKGSVLRFLSDSGLLGRNEVNQDSMDSQRLEAITDVECTDLTDVVLSLGDQYELHGPKFANRQIVEAIIDLEYADLSEVNLSDAKFMGIDLSGTNLTEANLYEADLSGADLSRANLSRANLVPRQFETDG